MSDIHYIKTIARNIKNINPVNDDTLQRNATGFSLWDWFTILDEVADSQCFK